MGNKRARHARSLSTKKRIGPNLNATMERRETPGLIISVCCFSFDVRGRPYNKAALWSDKNVFGPRAYFATVSKPAHLTLQKVQLDDEGAYRCRVDFKNSPTRNFQINLTVIGESLKAFLLFSSAQQRPKESFSALSLFAARRRRRKAFHSSGKKFCPRIQPRLAIKLI